MLLRMKGSQTNTHRLQTGWAQDGFQHTYSRPYLLHGNLTWFGGDFLKFRAKES